MSDLRLTPMAPAFSAPAAQANAPSPKLVNAAHEFEASMMKELMAPLSGGDSLEGGDDGEGSEGAIASFAGEAMAKAISEHGGFGIANRILQQLSSAGNHSGKSGVPRHRIGTTPNSPLQ